ncbi:S8 family serine peptidase [archaeon]|nr:S8 family serine peptidase [archaeon]
MKLWILVLGVLVLGVFVGAEASVDREILDRFDAGNDEVEVIVALKKSSFRLSADFSTKGFSGDKLTSVKVNKKELGELLLRGDVVGIEALRYFKVYLGDSVGLVNASPTWNLKVSGDNLTGFSQTVCVIDTGINFSHPDLLGRNLTACSIDCIDKACVENCSEEDLNGHGTHVAGIVGASGGINGIAGEVGLIGVKVFPGASSSGATSLGITNAIDWCVDNSESYNISVISMSLGTDTLYFSACDSSFSLTFTPAVNAAFAKNISVVAASGNDGNLTAIGSPACLSKVIAAGGADKVGGMYSSGNRNSLVKLLGIAVSVNSTNNDGGYISLGGTSMATPMVSGAIAIINQLLDVTSRTMTPLEIESRLNDTGDVINDGASGLDFSRINIYDAVLSLDNVVPNVTLVSPVDNHINLSVNQSFVCNATDWQLANVTFKIWNLSGLYYNEFKDLIGTENETSFDLVNIPNGEYEWNCFVYDGEGNLESGSSNFSLTIGGVGVTLNSPENESATNDNESFFNCSSWSDAGYELDNVTFYLWNSSGDLVNSSVRDISGVENVSVFNWTFEYEDDYVWNCFVFNSNSNVGDGGNFSVRYDVTSPVVADLGVSTGTSSGVISWTTNELANSSAWVSGGSWLNSSDYVLSHSVSVSGLSSSTGYSYVVTSCDEAGNCGNDSGSFQTGAAAPPGGGGSSNPAVDSDIYSLEFGEFSEGVSKVLPEGGLVQFSLNSGSHSFSVLEVEENSADVLIESDPIQVTFYPGEEMKFNLSSEYYYDLFVRLNGIDDGDANFSIRRIIEAIEMEEVVEVEEVEEEVLAEEEVEGVVDVEVFGYSYLFWVVPLVLIVLFFIGKGFKGGRVRKKSKKKRTARKLPKLVKKKDNGKRKKVKA